MGKPIAGISPEEWAEWEAGADERFRRLFNLVKRMEAELAEKKAREREPQRRRRPLFGFLRPS